MSEQPDLYPRGIEVIDPADLPLENESDFDPCEESTDEEVPEGARFGTTSRHVLATWLPAAFKKWGVKYKLVAGWEDRGRPMSSGSFDPNGSLTHHTGSRSSADNPAPSLRTVIEGRSDLSGPLCQVSTDYNGLTYIVAAGRANHAGSARATMGNPAGDGNAMYIGNEVQTSGLQKMPAAQYAAVVLVAAAIADHFRQTSASKVGLHATTSLSGKWDLGAGTGAVAPYSITKFRADVAARLKAGPPSAPAPTPTPTTQELTTMLFYSLKSTDPAIGDPVVVTDGFTLRWISSSEKWARIKAAYKAQTGRDLVATETDSLDGLGVTWVGPKPSATYPIPSSIKVVA